MVRPTLDDSAALLRLLTDHARDVLFRIRIGPPPAFEYVSPAVEAMSGYPPEDFYRDPELGQRIVHPDDRPAKGLVEATRDGQVVRWIHRNGQVVHVEPRASLVRDQAGRPLAVEGTLRDVSARVKAEEALRESEARLRSVFAAMAEGVLVFDEQGKVVDCNASAERVLGWPREALLGITSADRWPAIHDDGTPFSPDEFPVNQTLRTGHPVREVLLGVPRANGSIGWLSISSEPLFRAGETRLRGVMVSCADVTAERRAWIEVRRREAQFQLAMECAGWDYFELDLVARRVIRQSARLGVQEPSDPDDLKAWLELMHPEDRGRVEAALEDHVAGRTPTFVCEVRWRHRDGGWRWILHSGRAVARDQHGRATRIAGTSIDITEVRELRERLRDADRMAAVGTLAAGVAHEINNPLAYLVANLTLANESLAAFAAAPVPVGGGEQPERVAEMRQALRDAMNGAERVRGIVRGLQQVAQPSRREERGPVDLRTEIEAAVGIARNEIAHRARLEIALPETIPPVRGAPRELAQVFMNLLVHAAHALPEGGAQDDLIRMTARIEGERVLVEVSDSGPGIDPADLPHLFDPFFTTRPGGVGRGLELSVCQRIVDSLGGTIEVESAPGRGSTFRVALPVEPGKPAAPQAPAPQPVRRGRVLVIDDEALVARSLARLLAAHDVTVLTSAAEALARATAGERWDVVLCDLMMPEMDGMELERRLSQEAPDLVPRIVYLTGGAFTDRSRSFLGDGRPHLEKPVAPAVLRAKVAERVAAVLGK